MRLHPFTAADGAVRLAVSGAVTGVFLRTGVSMLGGPPWLDAVLVPALAVLGAAAAVARYLAFDYELEGDRLVVRSGVLRRREREIPLGRVQTVDVSRPIVARVFGVATVRVETAGGGATEADLAYVSAAEARRLQNVLRNRETGGDREPDAEPATAGTGAETGTGTGATGAARAPAAREEGEVLFALSNRDLAVLGAVSFRWRVVPAVLLGIPVVGSVLLDYLADVLASLEGTGAVAAATLLIGLGAVLALLLAAWVVGAALAVVRYYGFTLRRVGDELRYERGLLERYAGTIPLEKVQALTVEENLLMRRLGYAALTVETAGYAPGQRGDGGGTGAPSAVPLADRAAVRELVRSLSGVEELSVERPPERARRRYAWRFGLVLAGLSAVLLAVRLRFGVPRAWFVPLLGVPLAPAAARLRWRHRGHRADDEQFLARDGFWQRATRIVPYYRIQTVVETATIFQRRRDLASVTADTASSAGLLGGDATAHDLDGGTAADLHGTLRAQLREHLRRRRAAADDSRADRAAGAGAPGGWLDRPPDGSGDDQNWDVEEPAGDGRTEAEEPAGDGSVKTDRPPGDGSAATDRPPGDGSVDAERPENERNGVDAEPTDAGNTDPGEAATGESRASPTGTGGRETGTGPEDGRGDG